MDQSTSQQQQQQQLQRPRRKRQTKVETLKKMTREVSILCNCPFALICYDPISGLVDTWPEDESALNNIIDRYMRAPDREEVSMEQVLAMRKEKAAEKRRKKKKKKQAEETDPAAASPQAEVVDVVDPLVEETYGGSFEYPEELAAEYAAFGASEVNATAGGGGGGYSAAVAGPDKVGGTTHGFLVDEH